ncbi:MAG: FHA domain-containing protein [Solirubrobacteraceae bacterium]|nr:FHA domain-containing protein [Solirubrobacteraceae bacterium]
MTADNAPLWFRLTAAEAEQYVRAVSVAHPYLIHQQRDGYVRLAPVKESGMRYTIGRTPGNHLPVPNEHVSGLHAVLERRAGLLVIEDQSSRNGTFVNGRKVTAAHTLHDGDELLIATTKFLVRCPTGAEGTGTTVLPSAPDWDTLWPSHRQLLIMLVDLTRSNEGRPPSHTELAEALGASSEATKGRLRGIRDKFREAGETASFRTPALAEIALMHEESLRASAAANDDD